MIFSIVANKKRKPTRGTQAIWSREDQGSLLSRFSISLGSFFPKRKPLKPGLSSLKPGAGLLLPDSIQSKITLSHSSARYSEFHKDRSFPDPSIRHFMICVRDCHPVDESNPISNRYILRIRLVSVNKLRGIAVLALLSDDWVESSPAWMICSAWFRLGGLTPPGWRSFPSFPEWARDRNSCGGLSLDRSGKRTEAIEGITSLYSFLRGKAGHIPQGQSLLHQAGVSLTQCEEPSAQCFPGASPTRSRQLKTGNGIRGTWASFLKNLAGNEFPPGLSPLRVLARDELLPFHFDGGQTLVDGKEMYIDTFNRVPFSIALSEGSGKRTYEFAKGRELGRRRIQANEVTKDLIYSTYSYAFELAGDYWLAGLSLSYHWVGNETMKLCPFPPLILRAFKESLYTKTSGGKDSPRSLTYHRSLVVDRSTLPFKGWCGVKALSRQGLFWCNERGVQSWEKRFGEVDGGGAAECVALGDAVHRAPPPVVHAVLRHRAVDPPDPALVPFPSAAIA
ncbi:hypothetical protein Q3G72_023397 [Acer saccharum]|nr:hypothetical protein Q3G72_023397 [Acer saccharum]